MDFSNGGGFEEIGRGLRRRKVVGDLAVVHADEGLRLCKHKFKVIDSNSKIDRKLKKSNKAICQVIVKLLKRQQCYFLVPFFHFLERFQRESAQKVTLLFFDFLANNEKGDQEGKSKTVMVMAQKGE